MSIKDEKEYFKKLKIREDASNTLNKFWDSKEYGRKLHKIFLQYYWAEEKSKRLKFEFGVKETPRLDSHYKKKKQEWHTLHEYKFFIQRTIKKLDKEIEEYQEFLDYKFGVKFIRFEKIERPMDIGFALRNTFNKCHMNHCYTEYYQWAYAFFKHEKNKLLKSFNECDYFIGISNIDVHSRNGYSIRSGQKITKEDATKILNYEIQQSKKYRREIESLPIKGVSFFREG